MIDENPSYELLDSIPCSSRLQRAAALATVEFIQKKTLTLIDEAESEGASASFGRLAGFLAELRAGLELRL